MTQTYSGKQQSAFSRWLRTGRLPLVGTSDGVEFKFNPWHDPADGRFTFAESGRYYGAREAKPAYHALGNPDRDNSRKPRVAKRPKAETPRAEHPVRSGERLEGRGVAGARPKPLAPGLRGQPNPAAEFVGGVGEGLYGVAEGTVMAAYSALRANPITTVRNVSRGIAGMVDTAIAAEDTPARIQISRAADALANASPREIGRATGTVVGDVALAAAPGVALGKISALRRLRGTTPRINYDPPQIGWVKENLGRDTPAKQYNDSATGARPGQAPTLMRTMPDGSKRPVKFDGIQSEYVIDRKFKVVNLPRARAQLLRQSEVLAQHRLIGTWEVPNEKQLIAARKMLREMKVANIKVRIVKP